MKLIFLRGICDDLRSCPNLNATDRGTVLVRGRLVVDAQALEELNLPVGEAEIPISALPELELAHAR